MLLGNLLAQPVVAELQPRPGIPVGGESLLETVAFLLQHPDLAAVQIPGLPGGAVDSLEGCGVEAAGAQDLQSLIRLISVAQEEDVVHLHIRGGLIERGGVGVERKILPHGFQIHRGGDHAEGCVQYAGGLRAQRYVQVQPGLQSPERGVLPLDLIQNAVQLPAVGLDLLRPLHGPAQGAVVIEDLLLNLGQGTEQPRLGRRVTVQHSQGAGDRGKLIAALGQGAFIPVDQSRPLRIGELVRLFRHLQTAQTLQRVKQSVPIGFQSQHVQPFHFNDRHISPSRSFLRCGRRPRPFGPPHGRAERRTGFPHGA